MDKIETISTWVFAHIGFAATFLFYFYASIVLDKRVLNEETIAKDFRGSLWAVWVSKFLPLLLIASASLIGVFWVDPEHRGWDRFASACYFGFASGLAMLVYNVVRWLAKKYQVGLWVPGVSIMPPESKETPKPVDVDVKHF